MVAWNTQFEGEGDTSGGTIMEELVKDFMWGISILAAYLHYNNKNNLTDINIISEAFVRDLLNILLDYDLVMQKRVNTPGYDLISEKEKILVQVSTSCSPEKIRHTFSKLQKIIEQNEEKKRKLNNELKYQQDLIFQIPERLSGEKKEEYIKRVEGQKKDFETSRNREIKRIQIELAQIIDIRGFRVCFFFLVDDTNSVMKNKKNKEIQYLIPDIFDFEKSRDIYSLSTVIDIVKNLCSYKDVKKLSDLNSFMQLNKRLFIKRFDELTDQDKVSKIIQEYAHNFESRLFLHQYENNSKVTLKNLFVEPSFTKIKGPTEELSSMISLLDSFLWDYDKDRLLFIDGDAAIGKTSLISWLCYHYLEMDDIGKAIFTNIKLVCIRLRDLTILDSPEKSILDYLGIESLDIFEKQYENALIVLEGADEVKMIGGLNSFTLELFIKSLRHSFSKHKIVVTSRPKFIDMNLITDRSESFSFQQYSLDHFSKEKRDAWIKHYEDNCGQIIPESVKHYLSNLSDIEADGVADTPLALYLMAVNDITEKAIDNKWILYHDIFHNAIKNTPYNEAFQDKTGMPYHNLLANDEFAEELYNTIGLVANRMYANSRKDRFFITSDELNEIIDQNFRDVQKERKEMIRKCCVLCAYWKENSDSGVLEFYHNNIRAFFMCEFLYHSFSKFNLIELKDIKDYIKVFIETSCRIFQFAIIAKTTWTQAFIFLYDRLRSMSAEEKKSLRNIQEYIPEIYYNIVKDNIMWSYPYENDRYQAFKSVLFNTFLFLKICATATMKENEVMDFMNDERYYEFYREKGIFQDWSKLYSLTVKINNFKEIGFGSKMKFTNMNFDNMDLSEACFEDSSISKCSFEAMTLVGASFRGCTIEEVDFQNVDLRKASFDNATIRNVDLSKTNIVGATFVNVMFYNVVLPNKMSFWKEAEFKNVTFVKCTMRNKKIQSQFYSGIIFQECDLYGLEIAKVEQLRFDNCKITEISISDCKEVHFISIYDAKQISMRKEINKCKIESSKVDMVDLQSSHIKVFSIFKADIEKLSLYNATIDDIFFDESHIKSVDWNQAHLSESSVKKIKQVSKLHIGRISGTID